MGKKFDKSKIYIKLSNYLFRMVLTDNKLSQSAIYYSCFIAQLSYSYSDNLSKILMHVTNPFSIHTSMELYNFLVCQMIFLICLMCTFMYTSKHKYTYCNDVCNYISVICIFIFSLVLQLMFTYIIFSSPPWSPHFWLTGSFNFFYLLELCKVIKPLEFPFPLND
jgi:hypothetical protein